ncbi:hypothetical protein EJD97_004320 [Solanum chilense]|uniref:Uncharacterized protein n=1 Tax=Solanum chilense TaxID=4083 RepID=A0A6N2CGN1_SOLCI|nr:hypothetical protein EJD97_004320 [Solanum chilense]
MFVKEANSTEDPAAEVSQPLQPIPRLPPLFLRRLKKEDQDSKFLKFIYASSTFSKYIFGGSFRGCPVMSYYAKFMKDLVPMILGRPSLAISRALVDMDNGEHKFRLNKEEVKFNVCQSMKQPRDMSVVSVIDVAEEEVVEVYVEERFTVETLAEVIMNFDGECIKGMEEIINAL